ncbi:MAG: T9SS type A sorting domain-containing protein [Bacteroidia bacterium]|nr:T9SS type A sorting domain-containing protein [Bacteroidia bacterium]
MYFVAQTTPITGGALPSPTSLFEVRTENTNPTAINNSYMVSATNWTAISHYFCVNPGNYWLVFTWENDNNQLQNPPMAIDEVSLVASAQAPDPALGTGVTPVATFPYNHAPVPASTCNLKDDIRGFMTASACRTDYLRSEDRVWSFIPSQNGCLEVTFWADTTDDPIRWGWFGLQLFEGNPIACGRCVASHTTSNRAFRSLRANVTSGQKYYLVLDHFNYGYCSQFLELRMTLASGPCATSLSPAKESLSEVRISPSPAQGVLSILGEKASDVPLQVEIFNASGRRIYTHVESTLPGGFKIEIPVASWAPGVYFVRLIAGDATIARPFMVE